MFLTQATIRSTLAVAVGLACAFVATGFVSSAYHRERTRLGELHYQAGEKATNLQDFNDAVEQFRKALLFTPDSNSYRLSLATALVRAGKLDEAESHLEQLVQEDPTNGQINLLLARIAAQHHHTSQAIDSYQRAVYEYWPASELGDRRQARWELIQLLEQNGARRNDVIGELLQFYGNLPPASAQRIKVGEELLKNGADSEAAGVFREILKTAPQDAAAHHGLAVVAFRAGDYVQARHEFQRALRSSPSNQDYEKSLQLTNEVVDVAPELPNISAAERLRRSENLLNRVKADLQHCTSVPMPGSPLQQRFDEMDKTLHARKTSDDAAAQMQIMAEDLWRDRGNFCPANMLKDAALDIVLPRLNHE